MVRTQSACMAAPHPSRACASVMRTRHSQLIPVGYEAIPARAVHELGRATRYTCRRAVHRANNAKTNLGLAPSQPPCLPARSLIPATPGGFCLVFVLSNNTSGR